jgi:hypothetical protein
MKNTYSTNGSSKFVFSFKTTGFTEMSESGDAGILSLPEEVLIKIAQHLGKKARTCSSSVKDPGSLNPNLNQTLLNPDPGLAVFSQEKCENYQFTNRFRS